MNKDKIQCNDCKNIYTGIGDFQCPECEGKMHHIIYTPFGEDKEEKCYHNIGGKCACSYYKDGWNYCDKHKDTCEAGCLANTNKKIGACRQCQLEENSGVCDREDCANFKSDTTTLGEESAIDAYISKLKLQFQFSRQDYCIGCGMSLNWLDKIIKQAKKVDKDRLIKYIIDLPTYYGNPKEKRMIYIDDMMSEIIDFTPNEEKPKPKPKIHVIYSDGNCNMGCC